jgi:2-polyprenyl-3-methyl-5-hydroxy-6-metoxy-1,4-benzoquinol methylase
MAVSRFEYNIARLYYKFNRITGQLKTPKSGFKSSNLDGFQPVDLLRDDQIDLVNEELDWHAFTTDQTGRRIGDVHSTTKRRDPQNLLDSRIENLDQLHSLRGKNVLEFGCFEGIHSVALASLGANVVGVDARPNNLAKTCVRAGLYGLGVRPLLLDLDDSSQLEMAGQQGLLDADVLVHIGVLYHLKNPMKHLRLVLPHIREAILLDTHVSKSNTEVRREFGLKDPFSGVNEESTWVSEKMLNEVLLEFGFSTTLDEEFRDERNGLRWRTVRARKLSQDA